MKHRFFIGRAKELERIENFTLRPDTAMNRPRITHIWGPAGIGKSAFVSKYVEAIQKESVPCIVFNPTFDAGNHPAVIPFYEELFRQSSTNIGDLEPFSDELKMLRYRPEDQEHMSVEQYWSLKLSSNLTNMIVDAVIDFKNIYLMFVLDDFREYPSDLRTSFCSFINLLEKGTDPAIELNVVTTSKEDLKQMPDVYGFWEQSIPEAKSIKLPLLTKEETQQLLEAEDLDSSLISKIYIETNGNPGKIVEQLGDENLQNKNFEESKNRGQQIIYTLNNFEQKWIQWAAIIRQCNTETISLISNPGEGKECMNWIRNNYPAYFIHSGSNYELAPEFRRSILAYSQSNNPKLYNEISAIIEKFSRIKHAIPNQSHRFALSNLGYLNYFDLPLLKALFDDNTYTALEELIENKPVYFRKDADSLRLASNIKSSINSYNELIRNPSSERLIRQIKHLWNEKQKSINTKLNHTEKELHRSEEKNRSLTRSLNRIDEEIKKLRKSNTTVKKRPAQVVVSKPKHLNLLWAFLLQAAGIAILYVDTLMFSNMSVSYLMLSGVCIISGIALAVSSSKESNKKRKIVNTGAPAKDLEQQKLMRTLEIDLSNLQRQKEDEQNKMEQSKLHILNLQATLNHSYLSSPDDSSNIF